ncbi:MAG: iron-sulfur cluster insertion protein ErpA [Oceanibaculum nanhaiense]|uniref:iron-sulfur cluster insertion protein ErpA n=1 Tax=Oceanibaculum nanhaiense TaxID=1909734 RepID=UPI0025A42F27|nr:iron-sulfur cluster insertion protein ErpA [Oceanibaculum nanhaiense]MDM7947832.1 iron-sulfur cluster insertion protein ErpA [Oceanibaculum nanhaiense]
MSETTVLERPHSVGLSASAARQVAKLRAQEPGGADLMLRLSVTGGGCSGFQYNFSFDDEARSDDAVFERDGVKLVVDEMSLELLSGSEVDYVEELIGASFQVKNPNAASSCGCGTSFAI